jgi:hypothetical protein
MGTAGKDRRFAEREARSWLHGMGPLRLVQAWLILSFIWVFGVAGYLYKDISDQVDASNAVARDLAMMDCEAAGKADCAGAAGGGGFGNSRTRIAETYLSFGFWPLIEITAGPPSAALVLGLVLIRFLGRRRRPPVTPPRPPLP